MGRRQRWRTHTHTHTPSAINSSLLCLLSGSCHLCSRREFRVDLSWIRNELQKNELCKTQRLKALKVGFDRTFFFLFQSVTKREESWCLLPAVPFIHLDCFGCELMSFGDLCPPPNKMEPENTFERPNLTARLDFHWLVFKTFYKKSQNAVNVSPLSPDFNHIRASKTLRWTVIFHFTETSCSRISLIIPLDGRVLTS